MPVKRGIPATESQIQRSVIDYLHTLGFVVGVTDAARYQGRERVTTGWPDISTSFPRRYLEWAGYALYIEMKRPGKGKLRFSQAVTLQALIDSGALVLIARSLEEVEALLLAVEQGNDRHIVNVADRVLEEIHQRLREGPDPPSPIRRRKWARRRRPA